MNKYFPNFIDSMTIFPSGNRIVQNNTKSENKFKLYNEHFRSIN